jgi:hypothetical protein
LRHGVPGRIPCSHGSGNNKGCIGFVSYTNRLKLRQEWLFSEIHLRQSIIVSLPSIIITVRTTTTELLEKDNSLQFTGAVEPLILRNRSANANNERRH